VDDVDRFGVVRGEDDVEPLRRKPALQRTPRFLLVADDEQAPGDCRHPFTPRTM
jgi:hypothetical protein